MFQVSSCLYCSMIQIVLIFVNYIVPILFALFKNMIRRPCAWSVFWQMPDIYIVSIYIHVEITRATTFMNKSNFSTNAYNGVVRSRISSETRRATSLKNRFAIAWSIITIHQHMLVKLLFLKRYALFSKQVLFLGSGNLRALFVTAGSVIDSVIIIFYKYLKVMTYE